MCKRKKPRRGRGKGTLFRKSKNGKPFGRYYAQVSVYDEGADKVVRKVYATGTENRDEAEAFLADLIDKNHLDGAFVKPAVNDGSKVSKARREALRKRQSFLDGLRESTNSTLYRKQELDQEREAEEAKRREAEEAARRDANAITIDAAFAYYRDSAKRPDSGEKTLLGYERQFEIFAQWMKMNFPKVAYIRDITPEAAEAFLKHLAQTRSRATRNKYLVLLRTVWRVLRWNPDAQLAIDPWDGIRTLQKTADEVRHRDITTDEMERTIRAIDADGITPPLTFDGHNIRHEFRLLFAIGFYTGLRLGDCATMKWEYIDLAANTITVSPRKTKRIYNRTTTLSIHRTLRAILTSAPSATRRGFLMPTIADIYLHHEPSMITNRIQAIFRAAGIETVAARPDESNGTKARVEIGFHSLRHFFSSWLDSHGVNHAITNYLTCHDQGKVEARYFHENRDAIEKAVATLPTLVSLNDEEPLTIDAEITAQTIADGSTGNPTADAATDALRAFYAAFCALGEDERRTARRWIMNQAQEVE